MVAGAFQRALDWLVDHEFDLTVHAIEVISFIVTFHYYGGEKIINAKYDNERPDPGVQGALGISVATSAQIKAAIFLLPSLLLLPVRCVQRKGRTKLCSVLHIQPRVRSQIRRGVCPRWLRLQ